MPDPSEMSQEKLARQVRQHLDSLKGAGVDWLPWSKASKTPQEISPDDASAKPQVMVERPAVQDHPATAKPQAIRETQKKEIASPTKSLFGDIRGPEPATEMKSEMPELTLDQRKQELMVLTRKVSQCVRCADLASTRTQTVFGVGQVGAELCFIGEAPGADEDAQGEPFVGAAGQLLNKIIEACKMKREEVYICNIIKCRPPGNRTPLPNEAANCREFLERQLELIQPKFICALGSTAAKYLLKTTQGIGQLRGRFHDYRGIPVMCTYHPAYLLPHRSPGKKKDVWEDMKMLLAKMGKPVS
jgi:DNA polymerase